MPRSSGLTSSTQAPEENNRESTVMLKTVAVIVLLFLVLLLPTQVAWMLLDFRNVSYKELWFASEILTRLHSCLNPVIYGVMNKRYRYSYIRLLSRMFCCRSSSSLDMVPSQTTLRNHVAIEDAVNAVRVCQISEAALNSAGSLGTDGQS